MFETSKLPTEQRTVTGNPVSFNTHYALPLDACKVSFSATQAGSGDPSPSNPRAISGVSSIGLNANSTPVSVSLGDTRYGGELDVARKKLVLTRGYGEYDGSDDEAWERIQAGSYPVFRLVVAGLDMIKSEINQISNIFSLSHIAVGNSDVGFRIYDSPSLNKCYLTVRPDLSQMSLEDFIQLLTNTPMQVVYEYVTPIEIDLSSIPDLSSIIGNNTFSTDTGTLEITFADLQTKSASGSVATFNTALAMPLSSCNIAVNAWQEGTGDPSPVNVRNIVPRREVNIYQRGINLWNEQVKLGYYATYSGAYVGVAGELCSNNLIPVRPNTTYYFNRSTVIGGSSGVIFYDINGRYLSGQGTAANKAFTTPENCYFIHINLGNTYGTTYNHDVSINYPSTDTSYHAYTGNIYTIQLGQEVYGAEVDVANGVAHCTWNKKTVSKLSFMVQSGNRFTATISDCVNTPNFTGFLCSTYKPILVNANNNTWLSNRVITIVDNRYTTATEFKEAMGDTQIVYPLAEPFDIQLTPTQIETLIGNNTIFADTGDIDLTYKDCDLAKRGDFRQVFKIPD